jgi:hypothetical protein
MSGLEQRTEGRHEALAEATAVIASTPAPATERAGGVAGRALCGMVGDRRRPAGRPLRLRPFLPPSICCRRLGATGERLALRWQVKPLLAKGGRQKGQKGQKVEKPRQNAHPMSAAVPASKWQKRQKVPRTLRSPTGEGGRLDVKNG